MTGKLKIGILTQPLLHNYGGLLQAYALSRKLIELGHDPIIIDRRKGSYNSRKELVSYYTQRIFQSLSRRLKKANHPAHTGIISLTPAETSFIYKNTHAFRKKYFPNITQEIWNDWGMQKLNKQGFNAYIVGSDQCWRPEYSPHITNYFLDFAKNQKNIKRIAYAASFGTAQWEFSDTETAICKELIQKFDAVSVREDSAITLCRQYFHKEAVHVLDPTMLWDTDFYNALINENITEPNNGELKVYILDPSENISRLVDYVAHSLGLHAFEVMPSKRVQKNIAIDSQNLSAYQLPSPLQWLRGFKEAQFVIADSFHGTVFSILYNIPFLAVCNEKRGEARFTSLLKMFHLEDRLIKEFNLSDIDRIIHSPIDWAPINAQLKKEREFSLYFLQKHLSS